MVAQKETKNNDGRQKIAAFVAKYSNKRTGTGYQSAIQSFLRCMNNLPKKTTDDKKAIYDYETLFNDYLSEVDRDNMADITTFSECLTRECVSKQSARQILTYAVRVLKAHGVIADGIEVEDMKREMKGGAATVDRVMTHDVICKTLHGADVQMKALILMLASSGMRIGELLSIKMSDIDTNMTPMMITLRSEITKTKTGRYTFIGNEATEALNDYLKNRDQFIDGVEKRISNLVKAGKTATVNRDTDIFFPITDSSVNKKWESLLRKAGVYSRDEKSGRNQYRIHSLRKFFISQLSMAGAKTLAEHLAGHMGYLDSSYRQVSPEFAAREYVKLQSVLICCIPENIKAGIKLADEKIGILMEKTDLQADTVEGLKIINADLRRQMKEQASDVATLKEQMSMLITVLKEQGFTSVKGKSIDINTLPDVEGTRK